VSLVYGGEGKRDGRRGKKLKKVVNNVGGRDRDVCSQTAQGSVRSGGRDTRRKSLGGVMWGGRVNVMTSLRTPIPFHRTLQDLVCMAQSGTRLGDEPVDLNRGTHPIDWPSRTDWNATRPE